MAFNFSSCTAGCYGCWSAFPQTQKNPISRLCSEHDGSSHPSPSMCLRRREQKDWKPAREGLSGVMGRGLPGTLCPGGRCSIAPRAFLAGCLPASLPVRCWQRGQAKAGTGERGLPKQRRQEMGDKRTSLPQNISSIEAPSGRMGFRELLWNSMPIATFS